MEQMHKKLLENSKSYANWHKGTAHKKIHWFIVIILLIAVALLVAQSIKNWRDTMYNFVTVEFSPRGAMLTLDPQTNSIKVGDTFVSNVILDTAGKPVDGVDIYSLHYDPTILSVVDDNATKAGIQITPGSLMDVNAMNLVDQKTGTIKFSQASQAGTNYTGKGVLASIHFKAVAAGSSYLKFDFRLGSTKDTNVAHAGRDQLMNVVDALYTVSK